MIKNRQDILDLAEKLAREVLDGTLEPETGARQIWALASEIGYENVPQLNAFRGLASDLEDSPELRTELEGDVKVACARLLETGDAGQF